MTCPYCNAEILNDAVTCKFCGADVTAAKVSGEAMPESSVLQEDVSKIEMKWFKLLIYFLLFADALSAIVNGIMNLTGGISRGGIYADFAVLKPVDIAFGIFALVMAAYCIFTRFQLAKFKKNAPKLLYSLLIIMLIHSCAYEIVCLIIVAPGTDVSVFSTVKNVLINVASMALYIFLNMIYFDRRKHLFVN